MLAAPEAIILDTETTGLHGAPVQIGVLDINGRVLLDALVNPGLIAFPMNPQAVQVHGITEDVVERAIPWGHIRRPLRHLLAKASHVLIYNAEFDVRAIAEAEAHYKVHHPDATDWTLDLGVPQCIMRAYAVFHGDYSYMRGDYRWQKLQGGDHSAIGDCRAALAALKRIAEKTLW